MKKKLRTLKVDTTVYFYGTRVTYLADTEESIFTIRIFIDKYSQYELLVQFLVLDDYYVGNPLSHGVLLYNSILDKEVVVNLNRPLFIRFALEYGRTKGWIPTKNALLLDGITLLKEQGYEVTKLLRQGEKK